MTTEEFKESLIKNGFRREKYSEYHNECFLNEDYKGMRIELFVDYYSIRIVWYYIKHKKVSKCYYCRKILKEIGSAETLLDAFVDEVRKSYNIK